MKIYTKRGDDGTTALFDGQRVRKDAPLIELNGTIDEAQAALGVARALCQRGDELDAALVRIEGDLWTVMSDIASPQSGTRHSGQRVSAEMIEHLEQMIDEAFVGFEMPKEFTVPGENSLSAALDLARTVIRRSERLAVAAAQQPLVLSYLNRLSDLCWALARRNEQSHLVTSRQTNGPTRSARSLRRTGTVS